ncbi:MAG: hypothetical protein JF619_21825 [Massilia sp.]|nr:hypothetical protein [Massilia sp.]
MASLSISALPPVVVPATAPGTLPPAAVDAVAAAVPVALLQAEMEALPLPVPAAQPATALPVGDALPDAAAMRPDQVAMARQLTWPRGDGGALAASWRGMVRSYGTQLVTREIQAARQQSGQILPGALLQSGLDARVLRQADLALLPPDAWRFTVHAGGPQAQHLRVIGEEEQSQKPQRRRRRAALRLELVLADGTVVTVQAEPLADGVMLELCTSDPGTLLHLRALQPQLEDAVRRSGLRVLGWTWRDNLPEGRVHARLPSTEAAAALSLPVFRAMAELALLLPAEHPNEDGPGA